MIPVLFYAFFNFFPAGNWPNLYSIDFSSNKLPSVTLDFAKSATFLLTLDLSDNNISAIPATFGATWINLNFLNLSANNIVTLPNDFGK